MDPMTRAISLGLVLVSGLIAGAQALPPPVLASCSAPPAIEMDTWPVANPDSIGATSGTPIIFSAVSLLANDTGGTLLNPLSVTAPITTSATHGGTITGMDPFVYTPPASFVGTDVFTYQISNAAGRKATGIVHVDVTAAAASVAVPGVIGQPEASATSAIGALGLTAAISRANSTTVIIGTVVSQAPGAGTSVNLGSSVSIVVSLGALVPNVVGSPQATASAALTAAGLTTGAITRANSAVAAGSVISQSVVAGSNAAPGSPVALQVSLGPVVVVQNAVPDVVGQTRDAATTAITSVGLTVGTVSFASSATIAAGSVISTSPIAGTQVAPGSAVGMVVSLGAGASGDGLVAAFGFDEPSGLVATDSSVSAKNGTVRGALRVPGKFGGALSFDGIDDWVTIADTTASPLDLTNGMTLEAWVKPSQLQDWDTIIMKERGASLSYALYANDGSPQPYGLNVPAAYQRMASGTVDQSVRNGAPLPLNTWTHVAVTYDGATQKLFVNGVQVSSRAQTGNIAVANGALRIGGNAAFANEFYAGLIDEVRVYNRARTAAQIISDMNTPIVR
jgi:beta-lactam-binding protein with PASTA domain